MFWRVLLFVAFCFSPEYGFAIDVENCENGSSSPYKPFQKRQFPEVKSRTDSHSSTKKWKTEAEDSKENEIPKPNVLQSKKIDSEQVIAFVPPTQKELPRSPEGAFWSPYKNIFAKQKPTSPLVRQTLQPHILAKFFSHARFLEKTIYFNDDLFSPTGSVLNKKGIWETNLERMKRGRSPVGHKGICKDSKMSAEAIRKQQRLYIIEIQHMTQKDTGEPDDPLCEMTKQAHMSYKTHYIVMKDTSGNISIIYKNLTLEEAQLRLTESSSFFIVSNVLHFREGPSLIDRSAFKKWRERYWKERALYFELFLSYSGPLISSPLSSIEEEQDWDDLH